MATQVTIQITLSGGFTFNPLSAPFTGNLMVTQGVTTPYITPAFTISMGNTVATVVVPVVIAPGSATLQLTGFSSTDFLPVPAQGDSVGTVVFTLNDVPSTVTPPVDFFRVPFPPGSTSVISNEIDINVACLHGSSLILTKNGLKRLDTFLPNEEVLSGENLDEYVKANLVHCPLAFQGVDHDAIIFEKDSLGENEPSERLIIDPGHPMCIKEEYLRKGYEALKPAGEIYEEFQISEQGKSLVYTMKWTDTFVQNEPSRRYDLLLPEGYNTYIANGIVVRAKGYKDHRYKNFV